MGPARAFRNRPPGAAAARRAARGAGPSREVGLLAGMADDEMLDGMEDEGEMAITQARLLPAAGGERCGS